MSLLSCNVLAPTCLVQLTMPSMSVKASAVSPSTKSVFSQTDALQKVVNSSEGFFLRSKFLLFYLVKNDPSIFKISFWKWPGQKHNFKIYRGIGIYCIV